MMETMLSEKYISAITTLSILLRTYILFYFFISVASFFENVHDILTLLFCSLLCFAGFLLTILFTQFYHDFFIKHLKIHEQIKWHITMFIDILISVIFIVCFMIMPTLFRNVLPIWVLLSLVGDLLSPVVANEYTIKNLNRIFGICLFVLGIFLKFGGLQFVTQETSSLLSVVGALLSVLGSAEKI